jgi:hypothetical protein
LPGAVPVPLPVDDEEVPERDDPSPKARTSFDAWRGAVEAVRASSARHGKSLSFARLVSLEPGTITVAFPVDAGFHRATVFGNARAQIEQQISTALGRATRLVEDGSTAALAAAPKSIAEQEATDRSARAQSIEARVREHPAVQTVLRLFGGQLEHVQVLEAVGPVDDSTPPPPEDDG